MNVAMPGGLAIESRSAGHVSVTWTSGSSCCSTTRSWTPLGSAPDTNDWVPMSAAATGKAGGLVYCGRLRSRVAGARSSKKDRFHDAAFIG